MILLVCDHAECGFPGIPWREPIKVRIGRDHGYACRVCIAQRGLHGSETDRLFLTAPQAREHVAEHFAEDPGEHADG